ncbi:non-structural maintenance of chromosomes element 1 [Ceratobasidium sp. AG-Ba]|nr:non-structural maintenance of chromosomes element 1 [Ceratobasidium sp. AG-Ba]QRW14477.1 non-structural maintenance of chromosomes element 1 [Ceratobasidium sp. AG-Ba]
MVVSKSDYKRLFIQAMMQRRWVSEATAKVIFKKCMEAALELNPSLDFSYDERSFATDSGPSFITEVNRDLERFDFRLSSAKDECTGETLWAIINTKQDPATMLATEYSAIEIQYFKLVIEQIVLANNDAFSIPATAALREVSHLSGKSITKSEAEHLLSSFVAKGWLLKSKRGRYSLSSRSLLELQNYFRETYPEEYNECTYCMEPITKGIRCPTENCISRMHTHCYRTWCRARRDRPLECPQCKHSWDEDKVKKVGEDAVKGDHLHRRVTRGGDEEEMEEEEEEAAEMVEEEDTPMEIDEPKRKERRRPKANGPQLPRRLTKNLPKDHHAVLLATNDPNSNSATTSLNMDFDGTKRKQTIYVGGIHEDSNESELMEVFSAFGDIMDIQIPPAPTIHRDQPPTGHRGFAFITFSSPADAQDAIDNMDLNVVHEKVVKVNIAKAMKVEANPNRAGKYFFTFWVFHKTHVW